MEKNDKYEKTEEEGRRDKHKDKNNNYDKNKSKNVEDIRANIPCSFEENCKFWKIGKCRYRHEQDYVDDKPKENRSNRQRDENLKQSEERKDDHHMEKENKKERNGKMCVHGKICKKLENQSCQLNHMCQKKECKLNDKCRYFHDIEKQSDVKLTKKDIQCKFLRNCREGNDCEYYHPPTSKKTLNHRRTPKNEEKEMYANVHFLTKQMKKMQKDIEEMKKKQDKKEHEGESRAEMH